MKKINSNQLEMFGRVIEFGADHQDQFPQTTLGGKMFAAVTSAKLRLEALSASQIAGTATVLESVTWKAAARAALFDALEAISRTAEAIALDRPGFEQGFRLPRAQSTQVLRATAQAFADHAVPLADSFIEHGMRPSFLDDLKLDIENFQHAIGEKATGVKTHTDATANIQQTIEQGLQAVQRLDAIVRNTLDGNAEALGQWERASYVQPVPRRTKTEKPEPKPETPIPVATTAQS
jgi:hypothetical protein